MKLDPEILRGVTTYAAGVQAKIDVHMAENFPELPVPKVDITWGRRYARVFTRGSQTMVHSFVDLANGNVLKADGWKKPTLKNPRGNVLNADGGLSRVNHHGADYL